MGMKFGPVKEAIKHLLVFFAQSPPKWFQPFPFRFPDMTIRLTVQPIFPPKQLGGNHQGSPPQVLWNNHGTYHKMSCQEGSIWGEDV
jgi:hypothetical protein